MEDLGQPAHPDEVAAAEAAWKEDAAATARGWLLQVSAGTLCTSSAQRGIEGYPFGSVVPFALTAEGLPYVLIADIAAHTANLRRDPRASLFVRQPEREVEGDPQSGWRVTVLGEMQRLVGPGAEAGPKDIAVTAEQLEDLDARYLERVPSASRYHDTHGFSFWRMSNPVKARYIAGFGKICWIDGPKVLRAPGGGGISEAAPGAIEHMNEDHAENMKEMCEGLYGLRPEAVRMVQLDRAGFHVRATGPDRLLYFSFGREIEASELRLAVIDVLKRARAARPTAA
jgi:putative heme iron utilization protein